MKAKLKELTSRSNDWGYDRRKEVLRQHIISWVNYFKLADMQNLLQRIDGRYSWRIKTVTWKPWKRIRTRLANLVKLGVNKSKAWEWANTMNGYWNTANSFILSTKISVGRLRQAVYVFLSDCYLTTFLHIDYQVFARLHFEEIFQYLHQFKVEFPPILLNLKRLFVYGCIQKPSSNSSPQYLADRLSYAKASVTKARTSELTDPSPAPKLRRPRKGRMSSGHSVSEPSAPVRGLRVAL